MLHRDAAGGCGVLYEPEQSGDRRSIDRVWHVRHASPRRGQRLRTNVIAFVHGPEGSTGVVDHTRCSALDEGPISDDRDRPVVGIIVRELLMLLVQLLARP